MVDVTIYRRIFIDQDKFSLDVSSYQNNKKITLEIERAILEVNEIMKSKVAAINGNCLLGYNIEIIKLKEEYSYNYR